MVITVDADSTSTDFDISPFKELEHLSEPKDASYADYLREHMYIFDTPKKDNRYFLEWDSVDKFLELFIQEVERILNMGDHISFKAAFDLYVDIKLGVLQQQDEPVSRKRLAWHDKIDKCISEMLSSRRSDGTTQMKEQYFVRAGASCRKVREFMTARPCRPEIFGLWSHHRACVFNSLLPTLDSLQRRAYEEIRSNVYNTVGQRLPVELTENIFHCALNAEEVPLDPRIIVTAVHKDDKNAPKSRDAAYPTVRKVLKTTLRCSHCVEVGTECCKIGNKPLILQYGPQWIPDRVKFAHNDEEKRRAENEDCAYHILYEDGEDESFWKF